MSNENTNDKMDFIEIDDAELAGVTGGKAYIIATGGDTNVRTGPGRDYRSIGIMYEDDDAVYLGKSAEDERGVRWYKVRWEGRDGWVSSKYTRKISD